MALTEMNYVEMDMSNWTYIGEAAGTTGLDLPADYEELYILGARSQGISQSDSAFIIIPKDLVDRCNGTYTIRFAGGLQYNSGNSALLANCFMVSIANGKATFTKGEMIKYNGIVQDFLSGSYIYAWYR